MDNFILSGMKMVPRKKSGMYKDCDVYAVKKSSGKDRSATIVLRLSDHICDLFGLVQGSRYDLYEDEKRVAARFLDDGGRKVSKPKATSTFAQLYLPQEMTMEEGEKKI